MSKENTDPNASAESHPAGQDNSPENTVTPSAEEAGMGSGDMEDQPEANKLAIQTLIRAQQSGPLPSGDEFQEV